MVSIEWFDFVVLPARLSGPRPYKMTDEVMRELFQLKASYSSQTRHKDC
jgi:hypothetical protein